MAINKIVNHSTKSHGALRNSLEYVLRDEKIKEGYVHITGPYAAETINYDDVYRTWLDEKKLWDKDNGRMYAHNIISFHKDEQITPAEVLDIGKEFCEKFFPAHQCVIGVHQDRDHLHCHIVTNSVSFIDGRKLHQSKRDLERQKTYTNERCRERGLTIAEKGRHFDGSIIEKGEVTAWTKDKYNLLLHNSRKSYIAKCAIAVTESLSASSNREEFITQMKQKGWDVQWEDARKHIVFQDNVGNKVRDTNLGKTFNLEISKETLTHEFERHNARQLQLGSELSSYYEELDRALSGASADRGAISSDKNVNIRERQPLDERTTGGSATDTTALLRSLHSSERLERKKRADREALQQRHRTEAEQKFIASRQEDERRSHRAHTQSRSYEPER